MNGNSGNNKSRVASNKQTQFGPTIRNFNFHFMNFHWFSNNSNSWNHTSWNNSIKKECSKIILVTALIFTIIHLSGGKHHECKCK